MIVYKLEFAGHYFKKVIVHNDYPVDQLFRYSSSDIDEQVVGVEYLESIDENEVFEID